MIQMLYYLIDKVQLLLNMEKIVWLCENFGVRVLLVLKCFVIWLVFDMMSEYMDGMIFSFLFEVKLGCEKFFGEIYVYLVVWKDDEIDDVLVNLDKVIFNIVG